jgi:ABC-2 type transport system permease protein
VRTLQLGLIRADIEIRQFFREKDTVFFTFAFPIVMLALLGASFRHTFPGSHITVSQIYCTAMIGAGIMGVSFQNLGVSIIVERKNGTLKRLHGTPMPLGSYFIGKMAQVLVISAVEVTILLAMSVLIYGVRLPHAIGAWITFSWVFILGITASSLIAIAATKLARSGKNAVIVITMPFVLLEFISGVFVPFTELPRWMSSIASVFPLAWMMEGVRSALLGTSGAVLERSGSYNLPLVALVLGVWSIGGFALCLSTFRWSDGRSG